MRFVIVLLLLSFTRNIIQMVTSYQVGCENDTNCKSWEVCETSFFTEKECYSKSCNNDDTCGDGAICYNGFCVGLRSECDITCNSWEDCISFYSGDPYECYGKRCDSDDTCGDGVTCVVGTCANVRRCESDATCSSWESCVNMDGVKFCSSRGCFNDGNCEDGTICHEGSCVGLGCESDVTCKSWEYCVTPDGYRSSERCASKRCDSGDTCGDGATCFSWLGQCMSCEDVGVAAFHGIDDLYLDYYPDVCERCEDNKNVTNFFSCETQTSPDCTICTDEPTPGMIAKGKMCSQRQNFLQTKCNKKRSWTKAKYCQASCYEAGNGYEGDECCAIET